MTTLWSLIFILNILRYLINFHFIFLTNLKQKNVAFNLFKRHSTFILWNLIIYTFEIACHQISTCTSLFEYLNLIYKNSYFAFFEYNTHLISVNTTFIQKLKKNFFANIFNKFFINVIWIYELIIFCKQSIIEYLKFENFNN